MHIINDDRPRWDANDEILSTAAMAVRAASVLAALGSPSLAMPKRRKAVDALFRNHDHAAAVAAVAAVRPAARDVLLAPKTHAAIATPAGFDFDSDAIDEHEVRGWGLGAGEKGNKKGMLTSIPQQLQCIETLLVRARHHVHSPAFAIEQDLAVDQCEQRVVLALTHSLAGMELRSQLPDQDVARDDLLAAKPLHAPALTVRIATVAAGALTFFMCHDECPYTT